ncbi:FAD-dependent monooxygenase [uncultured Roseibium sp.]|uniref:FAD-dependent monooxygenase n=1 Tax=uncultured Roseibium sp. TaxID=1936171 RepID=UPI003217CB6F
MTSPLAVISGAGVTGLASAYWLNRIGWRAVIIERAESLRGNGYMMGLSGPGYETAGRMGLQEKLSELSYDINENLYYDSRGRELLRLRYRVFLQNLPYLAVRRTDLVKVIHDALSEETELRFGETVTDWQESEDGIDVNLTGGGTLRADLLIGADGFRSSIRPVLFEAEVSHLEALGYYFAVYDIEDRLALDTDFLSYTEPGHLAEYYTLAGGRLAAMHVWRDKRSHLERRTDRWELLKEVSKASHPRVREFLDLARKGDQPVIDSLTMVTLPHWSKGRVLLLGDAAHCLTLVSGQGAGMALASAELLGRELAAQPDIHLALKAHEAKLRPTIEKLQQRSRRMASVFIPESRFAFHMRNTLVRHMPKSWLGRYFSNAIRSEVLLAEGGHGFST